MKNTLTVAQVQMQVVRNKAENIASACRLIRRAAAQGAELVMLPEMFCSGWGEENLDRGRVRAGAGGGAGV